MKAIATYLKECHDPRVVRMVGDRWPDITATNSVPVAMYQSVLTAWPKNLVTDYFITPGGFLSFPWPSGLIVRNIKAPTHHEINSLKSAAKKTCDQFLSKFDTLSLLNKFRFITLGVDSTSEITGQQAELILLRDLQTNKDWWTGKSYPTSDQESQLICINFSSHFVKTGIDRILVLGCHDLNLLSNRAIANTKSGSWRNRRILKFRNLAKMFEPTITLQHAHTADTPNIWSTAWSGLTQALPSVLIYAGAGRWYNPFGTQRGDLKKTLKHTAKGRVSTFFVKTDSKKPGVKPSKLLSTENKYIAPKFNPRRM